MLSLGIVLFIIGFCGSFLSGLLGMGGAVINYPMLLFIPPLLGVAHFSPQQVSGISMVQVFFTTLAGVISYRKSSLCSKPLVLSMGIPCMAGSLIGGYGAGSISGHSINVVYLIMAVTASILMLIPRKVEMEERTEEHVFSTFLAASLSFLVGTLSGIVGAGGAFVLIPIMLTILKIPTRVTIASSLAIVFLSSIGGALGKWMTGEILLFPTLIIVLASIVGAPIGAVVSRRVPIRKLRVLLAVLIILSSVKMSLDLLQQM